ncbi:MAG: DNA polymerase III subunit delta' [Gammaproteobacteria bacterium]|nr:DNA polymerase III subunit delta' [Gammaproteobacteria bacterium]
MAEEVVSLPPPKLLPWHAAAVEQLRSAWIGGRLSHALLMHGADGIGKGCLAAWLAAAVLCDTRGPERLGPCGECASCKLIEAQTHPDLIWVRPEEDKQQLSIDQVRAMCERLTKTSYRQGYKVAVLEPAHQMTIAAANSLLKTLEEPAPASLLILLTSQPSALLPTVRSRCLKLSVVGPSLEQARAWVEAELGQPVSPDVLEFAGRAPLKALEHARGSFAKLHEDMHQSLSALLSGKADVTQVAPSWADEQLPARLMWLDLWLQSLARGALTGNAELVTFPSRPVHLPRSAGTLNISGIYQLVDRARALKAQLARTALQRELAVTSWLYALLDVLAPQATPSARSPR